MNISYKDLKFYSELFLDYIYNFNKLTGFYKYDPFDLNNFKSRISEIKSRGISPQIADIIIKQNLQLGNKKAAEKFEKSYKKECLYVITGQQAGLFGGPLYTLYKALTAIKLSEYLKNKFKIETAVIFWVESDDHDFDEIANISILNKSNQTSSFKLITPQNGLPVGQITIEKEINEAVHFLRESLPDTEYKNIVIETVKSSYLENDKYSDAFSKFLIKVLNEHDILIFDPNKKEVKNSIKNFFNTVKNNLELISEKLQKRSDQVKNLGYHNQVKISKNSTNLMIADPARHSLKYNSKYFDQLDDIINNKPELLSTNVLLRPLLQDFIFPDTAYVAGPSEIAYFAQISDLYKIFGLEMPVIFPRASFTILNRHSQKMLDKMLQVDDLFKTDKNILTRISHEKIFSQIDIQFKEAEQTISEELDKLIDFTNDIDFSLSNSLSYSKNKTILKINDVKDSLKYKINLKDEQLVNDVKKFKDFLLPFGNLQERNISTISFLARFGFEFSNLIYDEIDLFNKNHKFVKLI